MGEQPVLDVQWTGFAVQRFSEPAVRFGFHEVGQHTVVIPTGAILLTPPVEVGTVAPDVDHEVDRR